MNDLGGNLGRVWQTEQRRNAQELAHVGLDQFRVTPTCPPSTTLRIRGGLLWPDPETWFALGSIVNIEDMACDFTDVERTGLALNFLNPHFYLAYVMCFDLSYFWYSIYYEVGEGKNVTQPFWFWGSGAEYATAAEAETEIDQRLNGGGPVYAFMSDAGLPFQRGDTMPLCGLILRNNGVVGTDGQILAIDPINRGRSYLWPPDLRPPPNLLAH
jgi:hypothetical protein